MYKPAFRHNMRNNDMP